MEENHVPALAVVIVTYNRLDDLQDTLAAFLAQREHIARMLIIDNCSTDGTGPYLEEQARAHGDFLLVHRLGCNTGGAGGFSAGIALAREWPVDWIFLTDDDALPREDCLENLLAAARSPRDVFGCTAVSRDDSEENLCWPVNVRRSEGSRTRTCMISRRAEMNALEQVSLIPFLGFMVSREQANAVAPPNANYFISGDDVEYGLRLRHAGSMLYQVRDAVMVHPAIPRYFVRFAGLRFHVLRMPPWRRWYDVRNRIWNGVLAGGWRGGVLATMSSLLRLVFTLFNEKERFAQIHAYAKGIRHGLFRFSDSGNRAGAAQLPRD